MISINELKKTPETNLNPLSSRLPGEPVSGTGDDVKKLRQGVDKVHHLRDEEQEHRFAEVSQYADYGKSHPGKVAESVSHKDRRGVPVVK